MILAPVKLAKSVAFFNAFTFRFCSLNNSFFRIFRVALLFICQGSLCSPVLFATAYLVYLTLFYLSSTFSKFFHFFFFNKTIMNPLKKFPFLPLTILYVSAMLIIISRRNSVVNIFFHLLSKNDYSSALPNCYTSKYLQSQIQKDGKRSLQKTHNQRRTFFSSSIR